METKLYYTRDELFNMKHDSYVEIGTNIMFTQGPHKFRQYKKLYLLKPNASDVTEIYVELRTYIVIVDYLNNRTSRWMNEFNAYVFYSVDDMVKQFDEANKNRLF